MYLPQGVLRPYIDEGLIAEQRHPLDANVRMYNYTHRVQYDKSLWDVATMNCRGLALDIQRECVVSACLKKFWNVEEHTKDGKAFPTEIPVVQEKIDGWYGHLYWLDDEPWIGTRGSFTSPGAEWATAWFRRFYANEYLPDKRAFWQNQAVTHIFEIVSPLTRIVVHYPFEGLVHLATLEKETGADIWPLDTPRGMRSAAIIPADDLQSLKELDQKNAEGFVCFYPQARLRLKIKFANYLALHRVVTGLSVHALWEMWRDGQTLSSVAESAPEEMRPWIARQFCRFKDAINDTEVVAKDTYGDIMRHQLARTWGKDMTARNKAIALKFQEYGAMAPLLFQIHKQREMLWKSVEPSGSETFRREDEGQSLPRKNKKEEGWRI